MAQHRDELVAMLTRRMGLRWLPLQDEAAAGQRSGPLTRSQRDMWAASHFVEDGTYNVCGALRLRGRLDAASLARAVADVHGRHPSLRTVFQLVHGEPSQHIFASVTPRLGIEDARGQPDAIGACLRDCARLADRALPLDTVPLADMMLYRLAARDHVLFVRMHHIIADALSVPLLMDDLARCYNARLADTVPDRPACRPDMIDYASWEQDHLTYANLSAARRYWRKHLAGAELGSLPLPPPLGETPDAGAPLHVTVDESTTTAIRRLVPATRSSPFAVVSAAIALTLSR